MILGDLWVFLLLMQIGKIINLIERVVDAKYGKEIEDEEQV